MVAKKKINTEKLVSKKVKAFAKINLSLNVLSELDNGYHTISSVMQMVDLYDELGFKLLKRGIRIKCDKFYIPTDKKNLVYKAANLLRKKYEIKSGVSIDIKKNIPVGGGMAGGSTDAAATLIALNEMWDINATKEELCEIGAQIGMDVPYCIIGGTALCTNMGEKVEEMISPSPIHIVVANPGIHVSTKEAYEKVDMNPIGIETKKMLEAIDEDNIDKICKCLHNDFESSVFLTHPKIEEIKNEMVEYGALGSLMSGSGSSVFCICKDEKHARRVEGLLKKKYKLVFRCKSI